MFSALFAFLGLYIYYDNFGWVFPPPEINPGFFFSALLVVMGLIMYLQGEKARRI